MQTGSLPLAGRTRAAVAFGHGVVVHYHEIGLKGRNRGWFERRLVRNLTEALAGCPAGPVSVLTGRLYVPTPEPAGESVLARIAATFGVAAFAPCTVVPAEIEAMTGAALDLLRVRDFRTFAVAARRATKELALTSRDINVALGAAIQHATQARVNLSAPDATVAVEVVGRSAMVYVDRRTGPGGLPVGVSGRVVSMLSGGIDSPVATYRILKRGARAILCHFHSAPFTDRSSERKAAELAAMVAAWQGDTKMYVVAIGEAQRQVVSAAPPALRVVLYRRLMVRIASEIARREGAKALVTGDSLGQVASQTIENITCTDDASAFPVLRPLVGEDKQDIIDEAKRIGTYETSILPYEDCCSLFVPRSPATRAGVEECRGAETGLDVEALVAACLEQAEVSASPRALRGCGVSKLAIVGAGMMGEALVRGLLAAGWAPDDIVVSDVRSSRLDELGRTLGVAVTDDNTEAAAKAGSVVLATKPQDAAGALESMARGFEAGLTSIVAGLTTVRIEERLGGDPSVVRAMPNTPARVGRGVTALSPGRYTSEETKRTASEVFGAVGPVVWVPEHQLDTVTALSGSGPAYVFLVAEAMVEAAVSLGLPRDVAEVLTYATIEGSGAMLREAGEHPAVLRGQVTSPGGTTAAALGVLEAMAVRAAFSEAIRAAQRRSRELGAG